MRRLAPLLLGLAATACVVVVNTDTDLDDGSLRSADERHREYLLQGDAGRLDRLLDDSWAQLRSNGTTVGKTEYLSAMRTGSLRYQTISHSDVRTRTRDDTGVVTGRWSAAWYDGSVPRSGTGTFTHVYVRRHGRWRMLSSHVSLDPS